VRRDEEDLEPQMNANRSGASQAPNDAFDFAARLAEVQQPAQTQARRLEVVQALGTMAIVQCLDGLELHDQHVIHQQVRRVFTDDDTFVPDDDTALLRHGKTDLAKLVASAFSYTFSRNPDPSVLATANARPMMRLERSLILASFAFICVHLRCHFLR